MTAILISVVALAALWLAETVWFVVSYRRDARG
jgi:hypothetical protein